MDVYGKSLATIEESDSESPNGGFTAVLSTSSLDRDGDMLNRDEWIEPLPARVPLDADHGMTVADTIGSFVPYFDDNDRLMMDATFASTPKAQEVRTLIKEGHINTVSVAFMNDKKAMKDGKPHRELLNAGVVAIPSNRDAVILESKALDTRARELIMEKVDIKDLPTGFVLDGVTKTVEDEKPGIYINVIPRIDEDAMKRVTAEVLAKAGAGNGDMALLQAIHDAAVHLGAICAACEELHADDMPPAPAAPAAPKPAAPAKAADEVEVKTTSLAEPVTFTNAAGETMQFDSQEAAREFFDSMLTSIVTAEANGETLLGVEETPEETSSSQDETGTPQDTQADSPVDEEPAPAEQAAAASEDAAGDAAESEVAVDRRAQRLELLLFASED